MLSGRDWKRKGLSSFEILVGEWGAFEEDDIRQYANLKSFDYTSMSFTARTNCLQQYGNIVDIFLGDYYSEDAATLAIGCGVMSFHLCSIKDITIEMTPTRKLNQVSLYSFHGLSVSFCQNAQMVELYKCTHVKDISALKNVPYVKIDNCPEIEDFSSLRSQHYLELCELAQVKSVDITWFINISYLKITNCSGIINVDLRTLNKFLMFVECNQLQTVYLEGDQYLNISFQSCPVLRQFTITGKSAKLSVRDCLRLEFTHFNNSQF
jgi:hypothetical protein